MSENPEMIHAPFTPEQVQRLNEWQTQTGTNMPFHPFTCGCRGESVHGHEGGDTGVLIATENGWVCPSCDYTQDWAHSFMAERAPDGAIREDLQKKIDKSAARRIGICLAEYGRLAEKRARGADVMLTCLRRRHEEMTSTGRLSAMDEQDDEQQSRPGLVQQMLNRASQSGTL